MIIYLADILLAYPDYFRAFQQKVRVIIVNWAKNGSILNENVNVLLHNGRHTESY